jgi:hypothetical protein
MMPRKEFIVIRTALATLAVMTLAAACARVEVAPIKVEPIHVIVDVNIRIDRQLDNFFAFEGTGSTQPASQPAGVSK